MESIIYCLYKESFSPCSANKTLPDVDPKKEYKFNINETGLYKFYFKANDNINFFAVPDIIIVVKYDYELLNIYDINNTCLYYENNVLFT